jgi:FxsC-like protein
MTETVSPGGALSAGEGPLFFMSHAGPIDPSGGGEDIALFRRFFANLSRAVARRLALGGSDRLGYMVDAASPPAEIERALATCRAFVPLFSQRYFSDRQCGREWWVFQSRARAATGGPSERYFVPVTWSLVSPAEIPRAAREVDRGIGREGRPDTTYGLYTLMIDMIGEENVSPSWDPSCENLESRQGVTDVEENWEYHSVVESVAEAIAAATRAPALASAAPTKLARAADAFAQPLSSLALRVAILAPTTTRLLPEGRVGAGRYGATSLDWAPYGYRALAKDVQTVTERLGYRLSLVDFEDVAEQLLVERVAKESEPTLLLIDNWALLDERRRGLVDRYVRLDQPWYTFMVVRDPMDPETMAHMTQLQTVVNEILSARLERMRIDLVHAASGYGSKDGFTRDFSLLAQMAESRFIRH